MGKSKDLQRVGFKGKDFYDTKMQFQSRGKNKLTNSPLEIFPPNKRTAESGTPVESRRNTAFTFTFSLKTSHGNGILLSWALTEF